MALKDSYTEIFQKKNRLLVILAHPDDAEIVCGGVMARFSSEGKEVRLVVTTNGGKGMKARKDIYEKDFGQARVEEQRKASEILGVQEGNNFNLQLPDCQVF